MHCLISSAAYTLLPFLLFLLQALFAGADILYWTGAAIFTILLTYQHLIVKPDNLNRVNLAFATTNGIASIIFSIFVIVDMYVR